MLSGVVQGAVSSNGFWSTAVRDSAESHPARETSEFSEPGNYLASRISRVAHRSDSPENSASTTGDHTSEPLTG